MNRIASRTGSCLQRAELRKNEIKIAGSRYRRKTLEAIRPRR